MYAMFISRYLEFLVLSVCIHYHTRRKINGKMDKLNNDNGFKLIFHLYFRKTDRYTHI